MSCITTRATKTSSCAGGGVFLFCLYPDLAKARFKDPDLPVQRIIMVLGLLLTAVRKLSEWLSTDALKFEFLLIQDKDAKPLEQEGALLEMIFREQIQNRTVEIRNATDDIARYADERAQRSLCHVLAISCGRIEFTNRGSHCRGPARSGPTAGPANRLCETGMNWMPKIRLIRGPRHWNDC